MMTAERWPTETKCYLCGEPGPGVGRCRHCGCRCWLTEPRAAEERSFRPALTLIQAVAEHPVRIGPVASEHVCVDCGRATVRAERCHPCYRKHRLKTDLRALELQRANMRRYRARQKDGEG